MTYAALSREDNHGSHCARYRAHILDLPSDGKIFRGINTGYVLALDANSGQMLWESKMADPEKGDSIPAAPIAWNGMVFIKYDFR